MAQILKLICDHCPEEEEAPAERVTLTLDGKTVEVDLCVERKKQLLAEYESLLEIGRVVKGAGAPSAPRKQASRAPLVGAEPGFTSPGGTRLGRVPVTREPSMPDDEPNAAGEWECGYCDVTPFSSKGGRGTHRARAHGIKSKGPRYACQFCEHQEIKPGRMRSHVEKTHPEKVAEYEAIRMGVAS